MRPINNLLGFIPYIYRVLGHILFYSTGVQVEPAVYLISSLFTSVLVHAIALLPSPPSIFAPQLGQYEVSASKSGSLSSDRLNACSKHSEQYK